MTGIAILFVPNYRPITAIPQGFPVPKWEIFTELRLSELMPYVFTALTLALLGAIDSLLTSVVADNMTKTKHKPNKELIGQGIGNSISAMFGGIPGALKKAKEAMYQDAKQKASVWHATSVFVYGRSRFCFWSCLSSLLPRQMECT